MIMKEHTHFREDGTESEVPPCVKPVSQRLGHCHHVRLHTVMLPGKHFPGTAHTALDFIQYKEQVMFIAMYIVQKRRRR